MLPFLGFMDNFESNTRKVLNPTKCRCNELIIKELKEIRKELNEIKMSQHRLENHNSFIVNLYLRFREKIANQISRFSQKEIMSIEHTDY